MDNLIEKQRDQVISETNTAQSELLTILERLDTAHAQELRFEDAMHGDMDLAILRDRGFKHINSIVFAVPGEITHLRNIPMGIVHLECSEQLLTSLDALPASLEEIDLTGNSLTKFDARDVPKLKVLRISNNELTQLVHLPETLETLECDNNQLRRIDLSTTRALTSLHCSNNPLLILEHVPNTLNDLVMENNPFTEVDHSPVVHGSSSRDQDKKFNYLESIYDFFRLKQNYDTKLRSMKRAAFEKASTRKAGVLKAKSVRAPCISCKRNVGTIFRRQDGRHIAICGDKEKPCNLDIQIFNGDFFNLFELLNIYHSDKTESQEKLIMQKLDTLFHYIGEQESVAQFKAELEEYNNSNKIHQDILKRYGDVYANENHQLQIERKIQEIYRIRREIELLTAEYKKTGNREILSASIERHVRDLVPAIQNLRLLKYEVMTVDQDVDEKGDIPKSTLVQHEVAQYKQDFTFGEGPRIIKYTIAK